MVDGLSIAPFRRAPPGSAHQRRPRLLVSVRNADEALAALAGGADIIDIKEPHRGALGMADAEVIAGIVAAVDGRAPVSAALGELREWTAGEGLWLMVDGLSTALRGLSFVKLGLAGAGAAGNWISDWRNVRRGIEDAAGREMPWVAVAYADARSAGSPPVEDVVVAAVETGCRGVLIDTWDKQSGSLVDCSSTIEPERCVETLRDAGLFLALAGRLNADDLHEPMLACADILGIRSAACSAGDRRQCICAERVAAFRRSMVESRGTRGERR